MMDISSLLKEASGRDVLISADGSIHITLPKAAPNIVIDFEDPNSKGLIEELALSSLDAGLACKLLHECEEAFAESDEIAAEILENTSSYLHTCLYNRIREVLEKTDPYLPPLKDLENLGFICSKQPGFLMAVYFSEIASKCPPLVVIIRHRTKEAWKLNIIPRSEAYEGITYDCLLHTVKQVLKECLNS